MHRSPLEDLREIEGADSDPGLVSASLVKLIYASRECGARVFDSDPASGTYVVVLEGVLERDQREVAAAAADPATAIAPADPDGPPAPHRFRRRDEPDPEN